MSSLKQRQVQRLWNRLPRWAKLALKLIDIYLNERFGGERGETISERLAEAAKRGDPIGLLGCRILDRFDPGHCERADKPGH